MASNGMAPLPGGSGGRQESAEEAAAKKRAVEEQRRVMLKQILSPEASQRLANVALVKPDKARQLEDFLLSGAQTGRITSRVPEEQLIQMLSSFTEQERKPKVTISRRRIALDSDEDDDDW